MTDLKGKTILFSGIFEGHDRADLEAKATKAGAKLLSGVTKNLDYLVVGEKMGPSKKVKAEELGITMITIDDFFAMLQSSVVERFDYLQLLGDGSRDSGLIGQLHRPGITLRRGTIDTKVDTDAMQALLKRHFLRLSEGVEEFYSQIREVDIYWQVDEANPPAIALTDDDSKKNDALTYICGMISIPSLEQMIDHDYDAIFALDMMEPEVYNEFKHYRLFDQSISECLTLLKVTRGRIEDRIYLWYYEDESANDTGMTIRQYMQLVHTTKGFVGWQYPLMEIDGWDWNGRMQRYIPQLFPGQQYDFSAFPKLEEKV